MSTFVLCHHVLLAIYGITFVKKVVDLFPRLHLSTFEKYQVLRIIMLCKIKIKTFMIPINV